MLKTFIHLLQEFLVDFNVVFARLEVLSLYKRVLLGMLVAKTVNIGLDAAASPAMQEARR